MNSNLNSHGGFATVSVLFYTFLTIFYDRVSDDKSGCASIPSFENCALACRRRPVKMSALDELDRRDPRLRPVLGLLRPLHQTRRPRECGASSVVSVEPVQRGNLVVIVGVATPSTRPSPARATRAAPDPFPTCATGLEVAHCRGVLALHLFCG